MVKRKIAATDMETPFPQKKKKVSVSSSDPSGKVDYSKPHTLMKTLLGDTKIDNFIKTHWEQKPLHVKRNDPTFYGEIFTLETLKEVIKNNELEFGTDINISRIVNNEKEILNGEEEKVAMEEVERLLHKEKGTIQFLHPQRYVDELWNMIEKLETWFGCLVGSCAYVTPACAQGVALHCDEVDMFHLQLEGKQKWKLYKPTVELSRDYMEDLSPESIGDPMLEIELQAGDLLYFPRGVIYESQNDDSNNHSIHLSVSTYQQNTWGDFMSHAVQQAIEKGFEDDVTIRTGLPINYLSHLGTGKDLTSYIADEALEKDQKYTNLKNAQVVEFKKKVKAQISKLVDHVDVNAASDSMCADFFASRLPPYGHVKREPDEEVKEADLPTLKSKIKIRYPDHVRVVYEDEDEDEEDEDESSGDEAMEEEEEEDEKAQKPAKKSESKAKVENSSAKKQQKSSAEKPKRKTSDSAPKAQKKSARNKKEEKETEEEDLEEDGDEEEEEDQPHIKIVHSLNNDRGWHMADATYDNNNNDSGCIRLHLTFGKAAVDLLNDCEKFTSVKDLSLEEDEDKLTLATLLFEQGLIEVES